MRRLQHLHVAILAGGRGTRTWPLSRRDRPKQFLDLTGEGAMLAATLARVAPVVHEENVLALAPPDLAATIRRVAGLPAARVIAEPEARSTAPAVALAALVASVRDPQAVLLALPSDHHVADPEALREAVASAARAARRLRGIVIFGAVPDGPATGFGYLVPGDEVALKGSPGLVRVKRFVEKPDESRARRLIGQGALWNSGMFCLHAAAVLEDVARHLPELGEVLDELRPHVGRRSFRRALRELWPRVPAVSFDHGILEKAAGVHAVPLEAGWSDVGTLEALARLAEADANGNRGADPALFHESSESVVLASDAKTARTVVVAGLDSVTVVDAGDVVLVCPRDGVPDLPALLERIRAERPDAE